MITTEKLFKLIEDYLFLFKSKEDAIKKIFDGELSSYTTMSEEEVENKVSSNLSKHLRKEFEAKKLPSIIKKYIKTKSKVLLKNDVSFIDNMIIESEYELSYYDIEKLLDIKEVKDYLEHNPKDESGIMEELREFEKLIIEEVQEETKDTSSSNYVSSDNYALYRKDRKLYKLLTVEEERMYLKRYIEDKDPEAFEMLVCCNQGLCEKVAYKYQNRGLSILDLIQECNIGLIKCLDKFDLTRKTKLSTYAMWWIDQAARRAIADQSTTIRVPVHAREEQDKLDRIVSKFERENGREPTIEELVELTGFTKSKIEDIEKNRLRLVSFDKKIQTNDDDGSTLGEFIKSDIEGPEELSLKLSDYDLLEEFLEKLRTDSKGGGARGEQIIRLRNGIELYNTETYRLIRNSNLELKDRYILEEIGIMFGVTRERIRQLERKATNRLKYYRRMYEREIEIISNDECSLYEKPKKRKYTKRKQKKDEE